MLRPSSTEMNLSKHLHSASSKNDQMREGVPLQFERFDISRVNAPFPFLPMGTPIPRFCTVDDYTGVAPRTFVSPSSPAAALGPCSCIVSFVGFWFQLQGFSSEFLRHSKILSLQ